MSSSCPEMGSLLLRCGVKWARAKRNSSISSSFARPVALDRLQDFPVGVLIRQGKVNPEPTGPYHFVSA